MNRFYRKLIIGLLTIMLGIIASHFSSSGVIAPAGKTPAVSPTDVLPAYTQLAKVTRIIDGDTIVLDTGQKVRYIGIDTPELHKPATPVQCFAQEAYIKNKELIEGKIVRLEKDVSEVDRYGRLLRFVYLPDPNNASSEGLFVNAYLVKEGYAHAATFPPDVKFSQKFVSLEAEARSTNKGLWSACR